MSMTTALSPAAPEGPPKRRGPSLPRVLFGDHGLTLMLRDGIHPTGQRAAQELWDVTASVLLAEFEDGVLEAQTAASDFSLSDLVAGERPVTFYTIRARSPPPYDVSRPGFRTGRKITMRMSCSCMLVLAVFQAKYNR